MTIALESTGSVPLRRSDTEMSPEPPAPHPLDEILAHVRPISLDALVGVALLQTRVDRKYFVPRAQVAQFVDELSAELRALQIDGRRTFHYRSVYFDTPDLAFFRQHLQGRRRRYKVRTRTYVDSAECMLEVKSKGRRGETVKNRRPLALADADVLAADSETFIAGHIGNGYNLSGLSPSLQTDYRRGTLLDEATGGRVTCDVDLRFASCDSHRDGPADDVLLETKSAGSASLVDQWLRARRIRPHTVSKYCIGVALVHPGVRANPWQRTLNRYF